MAQTTSRVVELQIKLQGAQSIKELEEVTSEINQELKGISTSSESFGKMSNLAKNANSKLKEVGESLGGVTSTEKAEAVNKMGQGLVGAFQAAAGASLLFGEKTGEAMQKAQAKVVALFGITDGLKKLTEAFSAKNIAGLKATVKGWQESAIAAKLFGTTARAAITATGIGILIVALGTLIANWLKVKDSFEKNGEKIKGVLKFISVPLYLIMEAIDKIKEKFGDLQNFVAGVGAAITKFLQTFSFKKAAAEFDVVIEKEKEIDALRKEYNDKILKTADNHDFEIEKLKEIGGKEQEILNLQTQRLEEEKKYLQELDKRGDLTEKEKERLTEVTQELELQIIRQTNLTKKQQEAAKAAQEKADAEAKAAQDKAIADAKAAMDAEEKARSEAEALAAKEAQAKADAQALEFAKIDNDLAAENLEIQKAIDSVITSTADEISKQLYALNNINGQLYNNLDAEKEKLKILQDEYNLMSDAEKQSAKGVELNSQIIAGETEVQAITAEIAKNHVEINKLSDSLKPKVETLADKYKEMQAEMQKFMDTYGETIVAGADLAMAAFDLAIQNEEAKAQQKIELLEAQQEKETEIMEERHEKEKEDAEKAIDEEKDRQEDLQDSIDGLRDEALDAEGERYQQIQDEIAAQEAAKAEAAAMEIQRQNEAAALEAQQLAEKAAMEKKYEEEKAAAASKANKLKKQQAIVGAIINTALSIVNALATAPNIILGIVLAAVAAAMGAVQIAMISKQPTYAEGGYTGDGAKQQPAGIVHAGEYVVPQRIVKNPQASAMLETLEGMRLRGYADGGAVASVPAVPSMDNALDYVRIGNEVARAMKENPMFVSWQEWKDMDNKMKFLSSRASLGKR